MDDNKGSKTVVNTGCTAGLLWIGGWLFTLGFAKLMFWKGVLAILIWPYYLGVLFSWVK